MSIVPEMVLLRADVSELVKMIRRMLGGVE